MTRHQMLQQEAAAAAARHAQAMAGKEGEVRAKEAEGKVCMYVCMLYVGWSGVGGWACMQCAPH